MSYSEYMDMFFEVQKLDCPYRAFTFDVVNSKNQRQYIEEPEKHFEFVGFVYSLLEQEEQSTGKQILLKDKFNRKLNLAKPAINGNNYNPMILGDMATYFVHNGSITTERMLQIFAMALRKFNICYQFHFKTGTYQTNIYAEGGTKLYKGYMPQILENLSKKNNFVITKDFYSLGKQDLEKL